MNRGRRAVAKVRARGFTLVELLAVIGIIALLMGLVVGLSGYASRKADRARAVAQLEKIKNALEEYRTRMGAYPDTGTQTQVTDGAFGRAMTSGVPVVVRSDLVYVDPWGRPYFYQRVSPFQYRLWSAGPDALDGGDDVANWKGDF